MLTVSSFRFNVCMMCHLSQTAMLIYLLRIQRFVVLTMERLYALANLQQMSVLTW